jgi:epoxyqueuosine reductase
VRGHAAWALGRIGGTAARDALTDASAAEAEPSVREELAAALTDPASPPDGTAVARDRRAWLAGPWRA